MLRTSRRLGLLLFVASVIGIALRDPGVRALQTAQSAAAQGAAASGLDPALLKGYQWRSIGPQRGGRSIAISGVKGRPKDGYFGATGGGLWKTTDGGEHWTPVTDGQISSSSVGAVAVSESNPDVVFIGMGESCIRGNIQPGDGVYKSSDAGKTWTHVGFSESDAISRIRIHPTNPDIVFVADFGRYSVPSAERGIYKSTDGGRTWQRKLFRDTRTGGVDITIDRKNPNVMFAALWEAYRLEYQMSSGGPGSGLFKSADGGETWTEITHNKGLPAGIDGKISVALSGADPNRVYAIVENENGGLFSSDDAGTTWKLVNGNRSIRQRAFYYTHVFADPNNRDLVYALNVGAFRSTDGGKTLVSFAGGDSHDLWIDPDDSRHVLHASDGGGAVSYNADSPQRTWSSRDYPTGQFYHVATTGHIPYHVCGAQQDSSTICVPSDTGLGGGRGFGGGFGGGRGAAPTYTAGGSEPGYIAPDPKDPDIFFAGGNNGSFLTRLNRRTNELREVGPYPRMFSGEPSSALKERWQWTYPIIFSPVDPNVLYTSSQHVWKTTTAGQTWERISDDLTRHDPKTMSDSGGPITHDMNSPEVYATVFSLGPGKADVNILWAGSDDGLIHVTRDGGKTWSNVTPKEMPDLGRVSQIDASAFDPAAAYIAVKRPLHDDRAPYIFRTHDFGKTWTKIVNGIPRHDYVHAVREDRTRRGLLYAGTQHGFFISYDDGDRWQSLSLNLPDLQVSDIAVEANDVTIATHGRGFYVLDDVAAIRQLSPDVTAAADAFLFAPAPAIRLGGAAMISYWLKRPAQSLSVDILDSKGAVVRTIPGVAQDGRGGRGGEGRQGGESGRSGGSGRTGGGAAAGGAEAAAGETGTPSGGEGVVVAEEGAPAQGRGGRGGPPISASMVAGLHHLPWDLQYEPAVSFPRMVLWGATTNGPTALPGTYQVRLIVDGRAQSQLLTIRKHPYHNVSDADLQEQFNLAVRIRDKVSEANSAVVQILKVKQQVTDRLAKSSDGDLKAVAGRLTKNLTAVEEDIYQVRNQSGQDPLNFPIRVNNRLASLLRVVDTGDGKPIGNAVPIFNDLTTELKAQTDRLRQTLDQDLPAFNRLATKLGLEAVGEK